MKTIGILCLVAVIQAAPSTTQKPPVNCDIPIGEDGWAILIPNPLDCASYYVCDAGIPILMQCPEGLHFNPVLSVCDWPSDENCRIDNVEV